MRDAQSGITFAHTCEIQGASDQWVVSKLMEDSDSLGHVDIIRKCDGVSSLGQVVQEIRRRRDQPTLVQHPPAYSPQPNGAIEKGVQEFIWVVSLKKVVDAEKSIKNRHV